MIAAKTGTSVRPAHAVPDNGATPATLVVTVPERGHEYLDLLRDGCQVARVNTINCPTFVWVEHVYVWPEYRGQGHGRRLLLQALLARHPQRTHALSCGPFEWSADDAVSQPAMSFDALAAWYARLGFRPDPEWPHDFGTDPERLMIWPV